MRSRNIKPGYYSSEQLADCSIAARYIFPGLWMLADCEGRLEDRPRRIKAELLPYDNIDIVPLLNELRAQELIVRYAVDGVRYIWIPGFKRNQTPCTKERAAGSKLPPYDESLDLDLSTRTQQEHNGDMPKTLPWTPHGHVGDAQGTLQGRSGGVTGTNPDLLIPDVRMSGCTDISLSSKKSGTTDMSSADASDEIETGETPATDTEAFPLPDPCPPASPDPPGKTGQAPERPPRSKRGSKAFPREQDWETWYADYPRKVSKQDARSVWARLAKAGELPELSVLMKALEWQKRLWTEPRFIPHPDRYLRGRRWQDQPTHEASASPRASPAGRMSTPIENRFDYSCQTNPDGTLDISSLPFLRRPQ